MAPPHKNTSKAAERRKQRRQRRVERGEAPQRQRRTETPKMAPLSMDNRQRTPAVTASTTRMLDPEVEYTFVRRDLWRLIIFTVICFVLMIGVLFFLDG